MTTAANTAANTAVTATPPATRLGEAADRFAPRSRLLTRWARRGSNVMAGALLVVAEHAAAAAARSVEGVAKPRRAAHVAPGARACGAEQPTPVPRGPQAMEQLTGVRRRVAAVAARPGVDKELLAWWQFTCLHTRIPPMVRWRAARAVAAGRAPAAQDTDSQRPWWLLAGTWRWPWWGWCFARGHHDPWRETGPEYCLTCFSDSPRSVPSRPRPLRRLGRWFRRLEHDAAAARWRRDHRRGHAGRRLNGVTYPWPPRPVTTQWRMQRALARSAPMTTGRTPAQPTAATGAAEDAGCAAGTGRAHAARTAARLQWLRHEAGLTWHQISLLCGRSGATLAAASTSPVRVSAATHVRVRQVQTRVEEAMAEHLPAVLAADRESLRWPARSLRVIGELRGGPKVTAAQRRRAVFTPGASGYSVVDQLRRELAERDQALRPARWAL